MSKGDHQNPYQPGTSFPQSFSSQSFPSAPGGFDSSETPQGFPFGGQVSAPGGFSIGSAPASGFEPFAASSGSPFSFDTPAGGASSSGSPFSFDTPAGGASSSGSSFSFDTPAGGASSSGSPFSFDTPAGGASSSGSPFSFDTPAGGASSSGSPFSFDTPAGGASSGSSGFTFDPSGTSTVSGRQPFRLWKLLLPFAAIFSVLAALLSGRSSPKPVSPAVPTPTPAPAIVLPPSPTADTYPTPSAAPTSDPIAAPVGQPGVSSSQTAPPRYYEQRLSTEDWGLYHQIGDALSLREDQLSVTLRDHEAIVPLFEQVVADYPEYFWVSGIDHYEYREMSDGQWDVTVYFTYSCSKEELPQRKAAVEAIAAQLKAELGGKSDYAKAKGVYEYLIDHTIYDLAYRDQSLYSVLIQGRGVCAGYAAATQYLLNNLGIEAFCISGTAGNDGKRESHSWNMAKLDGEWYLIDTTWGDPVADDGSQTLTYTYFCLTTSLMNRNHYPETPYDLPLCTATACNYFVHEGKYLSSYSFDAVRNLLLQAVAGREKLYFRCADKACYDAVVQDLFKNDRCWELLESSGSSLYDPHSMSYSLDDELLIVTIHIAYY